MTANESSVTPVPEHVGTVTPRLVLRKGESAIDFYAEAFGAELVGEVHRDPDGALINAEVRIGSSVVMLTDERDESPNRSPESLLGLTTAVMAMYFTEVDPAWERALAAGAEVIFPLADQPYGERSGRLRDPFGQQWMLSQRTEDVSASAVARRRAAAD